MYSSAPKNHAGLWTLLFVIAFVLAMVVNYFWFRSPAHTTASLPTAPVHVVQP